MIGLERSKWRLQRSNISWSKLHAEAASGDRVASTVLGVAVLGLTDGALLDGNTSLTSLYADLAANVLDEIPSSSLLSTLVGSGVENKSLVAAAKLINLVHLDLPLSSDPSESGMKRIAQLHKLEYLSVVFVSDACLKNVVVNNPRLHTIIFLDGSTIGDDSLRCISDTLPNIQKFSVCSTQAFSTKELLHFTSRCRDLRHLDLSYCDVEDVVLLNISDNLNQLLELYLESSRKLTADGFVRIGSLNQLRVFCITECLEVKFAVTRYLQQLPKLEELIAYDTGTSFDESDFNGHVRVYSN